MRALEEWVDEFRASSTYGQLGEAVRLEVEFGVAMIGAALNRGTATSQRSLADVGVDEVRCALLNELPSRVGAVDVNAFVEAALAWLLWAAKLGGSRSSHRVRPPQAPHTDDRDEGVRDQAVAASREALLGRPAPNTSALATKRFECLNRAARRCC